jgi:hypothetical protein
MYTPNNSIVYVGAGIGAINGLCVSGKIIDSQDPNTYAGVVGVALAVAQAIDSQIPAGFVPPIPIIPQLAAALVSGVFQNRYATPNAKNLDPNTWIPLAKAILALGNAATAGINGSLTGPAVAAELVAYTPSNLADWSGDDPKDVETALNRIAAKITPIP